MGFVISYYFHGSFYPQPWSCVGKGCIFAFLGSLPASGLPGYLFLTLTTCFFKKESWCLLLVSLIAATFLVLIGTVLGVGFPVRKLWPAFHFYQTHFIKTARYAGLIYLVLSFGLHRQKKNGFLRKACSFPQSNSCSPL